MQRRRLLLAFAEVVAEHGLEGAGVGRVCKRAGVSRRTFYDLFDDREACFLAVLEDAIERLSQRVRPACASQSRWRERMRMAFAAMLGFFEEEPALARTCIVETLKAGPLVIERRRQILDVLISAVDQGRGEAKKRTGPPPLTADSTVGGALSVIHARVLDCSPAVGGLQTGEEGFPGLLDLLNPLMSMIVHPYLGSAAAHAELNRPVPQTMPKSDGHFPTPVQDPFRDLPIRITFRTARVLATIAAQPGASNREIGDAAGIPDQGQISKLLRRLAAYGLIENHGHGHAKGEPNAWQLTNHGHTIHHTIKPPAT
jgi:AcrR family transcriptional regulator